MTTYVLPNIYTGYDRIWQGWDSDIAYETTYGYEVSTVEFFLDDRASKSFIVKDGAPASAWVDWYDVFGYERYDSRTYIATQEFQLYQFIWDEGVTYLFGATQNASGWSSSEPSYYYDANWMTLAGPALPTFEDLPDQEAHQAFLEFLDSGDLQPAGWPLEEGDTFEWTDFPTVTYTEDDVISVYYQKRYEVHSGIGDDIFVANSSWGRLLDGGEGYDTVRFGSEVAIDLNEQKRNKGAAEDYVLVDIEHVVAGYGDDHLFGSEEDDDLSGGGGVDKLLGRGGDDRLYGGDGDDILRGGLGADLLDGGEGKDWASYTFEDGPLIIDMQSPGTSTGAAQGDVFVSIEVIEGTESWDAIRGDYTDNILIGAGGNDTLRGREGDDALFGQEGDDDLFGDAGDDFLRGGEGNDSFYFHGGTDLISDFTVGEDRVFISNAHASGAVLDFQDIAEAAVLRDGVLYLEFGKHALGFDGYDSVYDVADWISGF